MKRVQRFWFVLPLMLAWLQPGAMAAAPIANQDFTAVWERTDRPVAELRVNRTWMWGPQALTGPLTEAYRESPGGQRLVQYFDKTRMEINDPNADRGAPWYVTNGLLARELITGARQIGDALSEPGTPAGVNVAGDANDPAGPTYATFNGLMSALPVAVGTTIVQTVDRAGVIGVDEALGSYGVTAALLAPETNHTIASVFWDFMNQTGLIFHDNQFVEQRLSENPYYIAGLPLTEAYWTRVRVDGAVRLVLVQVFERRVLTYTPDNPAGWRVEAGNVGQHYVAWRYSQSNTEPPPPPPNNPPPPQEPGPVLPATTGDVRITGIMANPAGSQATGEYVDIKNFDSVAVQLQGWMLLNSSSDSYTFPSFVLSPGASVRLHVCSGTNSATNLYWGRCQETWRNTGDTGYLYDTSGILIDSFSYTPSPAGPPAASGEATCLNATESAFLSLINDYRAQHGVAPLAVSAALNVASYKHSLDMGTRRYFAHDTKLPLPAGQSGPLPWDRMRDAGYDYNTNMGENIAAGFATAQAVFQGWKDSPNHNAAMLNGNYRAIGIGLAVVAGSPDGSYWTTDFGGVVDAAPSCS